MQADFVPSYRRLLESGELSERVRLLDSMLRSCTICPHGCGNNRVQNEIARCYSGYLPIVSAYAPHFGEEPVLVGTRGIGNIFFGNCNLRCVYCQNYQISQRWQEERGNEISCERLAEMMLELQEKGCHAVGFVSPTHFVPQIVKALEHAARKGLFIPLVYNTNAYDALPVVQLLDGIIDIYLPDLKYSEDEMGYRYSKIRDYSIHARAAITEMHRQVGNELVLDHDGVLRRGLLIRHLVLPNDIAGSKESLRWIRSTLGERTALSVMSQYYPTHRALTTELLDRKIRQREYENVLAYLELLGFEEGWTQDVDASDYYRPEFEDRMRPFKGDADNRP